MLRRNSHWLFVLVLTCVPGTAVAGAEPGAVRADGATEAAGTQGSPAAGIQRVAQTQYRQDLDATFQAGIAADGSAWIGVRAGELTFDKWVTAAGHTTVEIAYQRDRVRLDMTAQYIRVTRGRRSAAITPTPQADSEANAGSVRRLLIGSRAVRAFRALTSALERNEDGDTALTMATMLDGALVALLDGDDSAIERMGRRVTRRARSRVRQATFATAQFTDCVTEYERAILNAYGILESCYSQPSWFYYLLNYPFCSFEYLLRAEQYIFQFVSCMAIP